MKKLLAVIICILVSSSLAYGKNIVVGSHGGWETYINPALGDTYEPFSLHAGVDDNGNVKDSNWLGDEDNKRYGAHSVDAAIVYLKENIGGSTVYAMMSVYTANPSVAYYFIKDNYNSGDKVFLLGYSAGGKFVLSLSEWLNLADVPVHILGMIDPIVGNNITIPSNVEKVALYHQESDVTDFQGFNSFTLENSSQTSYFSGHPRLIEGEGINHFSIPWREDVWKDFGQKMVSAADSGSDGQNICDGFSNDFINGQVKDELIDSQWDSICRGWHPLIERFRNKSTCKLVPTYTPADTKLYVYGNYCELLEYDFASSVEFSGENLPPDPSNPEIINPGTIGGGGMNDMKIQDVTLAKGANSERHSTLYQEPGEKFYAFVQIKNSGTAIAYNFKIKWYIDAGERNFNRADEDYQGSMRIDEFNPDAEIRYAKELTSPTEEGVYWVYACITSIDNDEDEGNNCADEDDREEYGKLVVANPYNGPIETPTTPTGKTWSQLTAGEKAAVLQIILD